MILCKLLVDWNGHTKDTFQYFDDIEADLLIRRGIVESAYGEKPELPRNFRHGL